MAIRKIKKGEKILEDRPLIVGPVISAMPICFSCNEYFLDYKCEKCNKCGKAILCSNSCTGKLCLNVS